MMKQIKQLLDAKGRDVLSIAPDASVLDAIRTMAENSIGALVVIQDNKLAGIVTERDYARKVILQGRGSDTTMVREIMTAEVITTTTEETVKKCMNLMTDRKIRHLPVLDGGKVVGIISIGDLVKAVIADQNEKIGHLEHYISG